MKRFLSVIFAFIMFSGCFCSLNFSAFAANESSILIDSVEVLPGETVIMPVSIKNNPGLMGAKITVTYTEGLRVAKVEKGEVFSEGTFIENSDSKRNNSFDVVWNNSSKNTKNGVLFTITFSVPENADESYNIKINYDRDNTFNEKLEDVNLICGSADISVKTDNPPEESKSFFEIIVSFFKTLWNIIVNLFK